jgi:hypothetical protein
MRMRKKCNKNLFLNHQTDVSKDLLKNLEEEPIKQYIEE